VTVHCDTNSPGGSDEPEPEPEPEPESEISPLSKWLAVAGQCAFVAAFSLGVGPLAHVLSSELYPLRLRGVAVGLATFINRVTSGGIALSFLSLQGALTPAGAFGVFAAVAVRCLHAGSAHCFLPSCCCAFAMSKLLKLCYQLFSLQAVATAFAIFVLPETKGRSLEELERELSEMRICGSSGTPEVQHSFESDRGDAAAQSQSQSVKGVAEISAPSKVEWEPEFERTVGLHSTGGVGMQQ